MSCQLVGGWRSALGAQRHGLARAARGACIVALRRTRGAAWHRPACHGATSWRDIMARHRGATSRRDIAARHRGATSRRDDAAL
jgi:hypothetical protein